ADAPGMDPRLEAHGEVVCGEHGYTLEVRGELLSMSAATIDREHRRSRELKGTSGTRSDALLRITITVRRAGDEAEGEPGFMECDTVAHCVPALKGGFARTLTAISVYTGGHTWKCCVITRVHMLTALERLEAALPFDVAGLEGDSGSEFINDQVIAWAVERKIFFTKARPTRRMIKRLLN